MWQTRGCMSQRWERRICAGTGCGRGPWPGSEGWALSFNLHLVSIPFLCLPSPRLAFVIQFQQRLRKAAQCGFAGWERGLERQLPCAQTLSHVHTLLSSSSPGHRVSPRMLKNVHVLFSLHRCDFPFYFAYLLFIFSPVFLHPCGLTFSIIIFSL